VSRVNKSNLRDSCRTT